MTSQVSYLGQMDAAPRLAAEADLCQQQTITAAGASNDKQLLEHTFGKRRTQHPQSPARRNPGNPQTQPWPTPPKPSRTSSNKSSPNTAPASAWTAPPKSSSATSPSPTPSTPKRPRSAPPTAHTSPSPPAQATSRPPPPRSPA